MKTVAIIQARMGSTRLPGKAIADIEGHSMTWHVVERVKQAKFINQVVVAMPPEGERTAQLIDSIRDTEALLFIPPIEVTDLLKRYWLAAQFCRADTIVRIPADNPCVDPDEIDRIVKFYSEQPQPTGQWLYTNLDQNVLENGYPGGLGAEVYSSWFLHWLYTNVDQESVVIPGAHKSANQINLREHPHLWAFNNGRLKTLPAPAEIRRPDLRFDVNTPDDLMYIRDIYTNLYEEGKVFSAAEAIKYLKTKEGVCNG